MQLRIGQVFHLWCTGCATPKWKFHVLALINPRPRFFIINTAMAAFQRASPVLAAHQVPLLQAEHTTFLKHDSVMDVSSILGGPTASELEDRLDDDPAVHLGAISDNTRRNARRVISSSSLLTGREIIALSALW